MELLIKEGNKEIMPHNYDLIEFMEICLPLDKEYDWIDFILLGK